MSNWRDHPFHALLLLTEKPAGWPAPIVWLGPVALVVGMGVVWHWGVAACLLSLALADWALLASLPHQKLSFGPWQPPFLALSSLRGLAFLPAALIDLWPVTLGVLFFQILILALAWWGTRVEPFRVQVIHVSVPDTDLPHCGRLRIVQLSDLHVERMTPRERALPALVRELAPDLLVLTGDLLNTSYNRDPDAVADLAALLGEMDAPLGVYAVWGTAHVDYPDVLRPVLEAAGVELLEDRAVSVWLDGRGRGEKSAQEGACGPLWLMGVTPTWDPDRDAAQVGTLLAAAPPGAFSLLLYHLPDLMPAVAAMGVDAYLAGHTHGGQWCIPGFGALVTSSRYRKRYEAGLYREGRTHLYVSRGLGLEGFGTPRARLFCPPEVVVLDVALCPLPPAEDVCG